MNLKNKILILISLALSSLLQGCFFGSSSANPELAYIVAYSILDSRFQTSTRLDLTADIYNPSSEAMELTQLIFKDLNANEYILDYQTIGAYSQVGRYNAFPMEMPIQNLEILGEKGEEYLSDSGLHFLFAKNFKSIMLKYKNKNGLHEIELKDIEKVMTRSRSETIAWMQKEYQEKQKILAELEQVANKKLTASKSNN